MMHRRGALGPPRGSKKHPGELLGLQMHDVIKVDQLLNNLLKCNGIQQIDQLLINFCCTIQQIGQLLINKLI